MLKNTKIKGTITIILSIIFLFLLFLTGKEVYSKIQEGKNLETPTKNVAQAQPKVEKVSYQGIKVENPNKIKESKPFIVALFGIDTRGEDHSRTDTIMLLRYDRDKKDVQIVSIPRDSYVKIPGHGKDKINAAHSYGDLPLAIQTIEELMDIKIDYYARADFKAFSEITKLVGGVEVTVEKHMTGNGIDIPAGTQVLEGNQLLDYVRFRKDADGDFGRINRQQEVMLKLVNKMLSFDSLTKLPKIMNTINDNVDTNINWAEMLSLASDLKSLEEINIQQHRIATVSDLRNKIWYELIDESDLKEKSALLNGYNLKELEGSEDYDFKSTNEEVISQSKLIKRMTEDGGHTYIKENSKETGMKAEEEGFHEKTTSNNWGF